MAGKNTSPNTHSVGPTTRQVTVLSFSADGTTALCVDKTGVQVQVPLYWQRSKGQLPAVGETWMLSNDLGQWSFAMIVGSSSGPFSSASYASVAVTGGLLLGNQSTPPAASSAGAPLYASGGHLKYTGPSGTTYNTGRSSAVTSAAQTVSSTSMVTVGSTGAVPLSRAVSAIEYRLFATIPYTENASAGTPSFQVTGPASSTVTLWSFVVSAQGSAALLGNVTTAFAAPFSVNAMASLSRCLFMFGTVTLTAAGTLAIQAVTSAGADTFTILKGAALELYPVN